MDLSQSFINSIKEQIYPFTLQHLIYFIVITLLTTIILNYFLKYKLLKWIYVGTLIVIITSLYKQGDNKKVVEDVFKLATI
jgi:hypothetical protein